MKLLVILSLTGSLWPFFGYPWAETQYHYDSLGRLAQVQDAQNNTTAYQYNSQGQLLAQTDAEGKTTQYGYDRAGRRVQRTLADGTTETLSHNSLGQLTQKTHFDGSQTTWEYGQASTGAALSPSFGQITKEHRADGSSQSRAYDPHGRHTQSTDTRDGTETRTLDPLGRTRQHTVSHSANQLAGSSGYNSHIHHSWDANSQRLQLSSPNPAHSIQTSWDAAGQLQSLQAASDASPTQFTHDGAGRLTKIQRSDGSQSHYQYNADHHITQIRHENAAGQTLAQFDYQINLDGQRTQATEAVETLQRTIRWSYDAAGKLTSEQISQTQPTAQSLTIAYQYDKVGNRTARNVTGAIQQTTTYHYDANDRLTQSSDSIHGTTNYRYDLRGNLTEKANGSDITKYSWNSDNRLIKVEQTGTLTKTTTYGYDPQGRRIKKLVIEGANKTETHYHLDTERAYHEIVIERTRVNTDPWTQKTYLHTPTGVGELISEHDGSSTKQIYTDAQGSTRLIADSATGTHQHYHFDAFGNWLAGDSLDGSAPTHLYTGERFDTDTGLIYLRARDYDPETGRFISMDEHPGNQRIPLTLNKYLYTNADPVNHIDPSGYVSITGVFGGVMNTLSSMVRMALPQLGRHGARAALKSKKYFLYKGRRSIVGMRQNGFIPHFFIYASAINNVAYGGGSYRYDIGVDPRDEDGFGRVVSGALGGDFSVMVSGAIYKTKTTRPEMRRMGDRVDGRPFAGFTLMQYMMWERVAYYPFVDGFNYCLSGTNCASWSAMAVTEAKIIEKINTFP